MTDDATLLRRYADDRSEADFAEVVRRHIDFVYSSALRQVNGDAHLAQDVTQLVFTDLARKAGRVAAHPVLAGWLFTSTRFAAAKLVRAARRREAREQEAILMQTNPEPAVDWERIRPVLDEALAELDERDREAILLRYLGGHDFAEVGARLSLSANAARMRVDRAVEKLRGLLARRGATSTAGALALVLANQAVVAAPAGLATSVAGAAVTGAGAATALTFMSLTKLQLTLAGAALIVGTGFYAVQANQNASLRAELAGLPSANADIARLRQQNADLERTIRQAKTFQVSSAELAQLQAAITAKQEALKAAAAKAAAARRSAPRSPTVSFTEPTLSMPQLDKKPVIKVQFPPQYPLELAQTGTSGSVVVSFVISSAGTVVSAEAVESTHPGFEEAAVKAVKGWTFQAGVKGGRNVNVRVSQKIEFNMGEGSPELPAPADWF